MGRKKRSDKDELADLIFEELTNKNEYAQQRSKLEAEVGHKVYFLHSEAFEAAIQPQIDSQDIVIHPPVPDPGSSDASPVSKSTPTPIHQPLHSRSADFAPEPSISLRSIPKGTDESTDVRPEQSRHLETTPASQAFPDPPHEIDVPRPARKRSKVKLTFHANQDWQLLLSEQQFKILKFLLSFDAEKIPITASIMEESTGVPHQTLTRTLAIFRAKKLIKNIEKKYPGGNKHSVIHLHKKLCQKAYEVNQINHR
jgi:hypothetical protein